MQDAYREALEAIDQIIQREPEADEVLRQTVAAVHDLPAGYSWAAISFVEEGSLTTGPWTGERSENDVTLDVPVVYDSTPVATLSVASARDFTDADRAFLERVALLVSSHCLVGWDTGGVPWPDAG